jgi:uncharacterized RmlC-like cupin family protein/AcrR family transcriptional regulator
MFARHGKDVTLAQVAERAGVGKATVYRTYASRDVMVAAMLDQRLAWLRDRMRQAAAGTDGWREFSEMIRDVLERMRQDRLLLYVIVTPPTGMNDRMGPVLGPLFAAVLVAGKDSGRVRADISGSDLGILMSGAAAALAIKEDFDSASWQRAADLILAACGTYPHLPGRARSVTVRVMSDDHWHRPLSLVKGEDVTGDTSQTPGMARREAISGKSVGSDRLWMGQTHVAAGVKSADHHHGESETAIYVVSGTPSFVFAEGDQEVRLDAKPGDYVFVPPYVPHREENTGGEEAVVVIARTTQEAIVVNLPSLWAGRP